MRLVANVACVLLSAVSTVRAFYVHSAGCVRRIRSVGSQQAQLLHASYVWVEEAEDGFVDGNENLEEGEVCIRALKAFASVGSGTDGDDDPKDTEDKIFLGAGALVQRPESRICDAWMGDSLEANANLQVQGADLVLDELLWTHLQTRSIGDQLGRAEICLETARSIAEALSDFRVQCGSLDSDCTCASYMAATNRGFVPYHETVFEQSSVHNSRTENRCTRTNRECINDDGVGNGKDALIEDRSGMIIVPDLAYDRYQFLQRSSSINDERVNMILQCLSAVVDTDICDRPDTASRFKTSVDYSTETRSPLSTPAPPSPVARQVIQSYFQEQTNRRRDDDIVR